MRRLARVALGALLVLASALALGVLVPRGTGEGAGEGDRVLVLSGPIHTDIALPLDAKGRARFAFLAEAGVPVDDPRAEWVVLGWGGRAFYLSTPTWADLRPGPVLRSLGWDASLVHAEVLGPIDLAHPAVRALAVTPDARDRIEAAILAAFARPGGAPRPVAGGYGATDRFFEGVGGFNLLWGCNTWTAAILRAGGLRTGAWTPLPATLDASLRLHASP